MKSIPHYSLLVRALGGLLLGAAALTACNEVRIPGVYRIDIQQGNVITQEQLAALESGMDKRKVRFILGTPLVTDAFNQQRWDYYYSLEQPGEERVQRIISVFFEGDRLSRVGGDVRAATGPIKQPERVDKVVTVPDGYRDEGLFASLTPSFLSGKPKRQPRDADQAQTKIAAAAPTEAPAQPAVTSPATTTALAPASIDVDAQDERYLRDLLGDLGREAPAQAPTSGANESAAAGGAQEKEEEGVLLRWAKRLGWGDSEPADAAVPSAGTPSPVE